MSGEGRKGRLGGSLDRRNLSPVGWSVEWIAWIDRTGNVVVMAVGQLYYIL